MKLNRGTCIVGILLSYAFLTLLYVTLVKDAKMRYPCTIEEPCVRFCCNNASLCKDDFIRAQFEANFTVQLDGDYENRAKDYIILRGTPTCDMKSVGKEIQEIGTVRQLNDEFSLKFLRIIFNPLNRLVESTVEKKFMMRTSIALKGATTAMRSHGS